MTDGEALRRVILAEPDDDTPRLIYADWLDENGQPDRAAFIRAQIEAVHAEPYSLQARSAAARAESLLVYHKSEWLKPVAANGIKARFVRGFVGHAEVSVARFPEVAAKLFAEPVQSLHLIRHDNPGEWAPFLPCLDVPQLDRVRQFDCWLGYGTTDEEYAAIGESPRLARLTDLSLKGNPIQPKWLSKLLGGRTLPNLAGLNLSDIPHIGPGLADAAEPCGHRRFKRLDASGVAFRWGDLRRLLTSPCLSQVEELELRPPASTDPGPGPLSHLNLGWVLPWDTLRKLDIGGQRLGAAAVREFTELPDSANLRWLGLAVNDLGTAGVQALIESPHLNLNHLDVRGNYLTQSDIAALQSRFPNALIES